MWAEFKRRDKVYIIVLLPSSSLWESAKGQALATVGIVHAPSRSTATRKWVHCHDFRDEDGKNLAQCLLGRRWTEMQARVQVTPEPTAFLSHWLRGASERVLGGTKHFSRIVDLEMGKKISWSLQSKQQHVIVNFRRDIWHNLLSTLGGLGWWAEWTGGSWVQTNQRERELVLLPDAVTRGTRDGWAALHISRQ